MSATVLKLIALALMLGDHIAEFIPGAPIWLHWLGRISAPLFIFCMCEGFFHTHDRKKYLLRIYLCGVGMSLLDVALIAIVPKPYNMPVNNIFVTLAIISAIIGLIEGFRARKRGTWKWLIAFLALQLVSIFACAYAYMGTGIIGVLLFTSALLPSIFYCEGGVFVVLLGVMLYY
ncbi:MAG: TraX family protein, partial [Oscillospiraceae bacterium]